MAFTGPAGHTSHSGGSGIRGRSPWCGRSWLKQVIYSNRVRQLVRLAQHEQVIQARPKSSAKEPLFVDPLAR